MKTLAVTDEIDDQIDQNSVIQALKSAPQPNAPPTIAQAIVHQQRWGMPSAGQQFSGISQMAHDALPSAPDLTPVREPGTPPTGYMTELLRNPDIRQRSIDQAGFFAGMQGVTRNRTSGAFWSDPQNVAKFIELRNQGKSFAEIANRLGTSRGAVAGRIWREQNPRARTLGEPYWTEVRDAALTHWLDKGYSFAEVARAMDTSRGAIAGRARVLGLQTSNRPIGIRLSQARTPGLASLNLPPAENVSPAEMAEFLKTFHGDK